MLTRREILSQLKSVGVGKLILLKWHCRDFESYMRANYDLGMGSSPPGEKDGKGRYN